MHNSQCVSSVCKPFHRYTFEFKIFYFILCTWMHNNARKMNETIKMNTWAHFSSIITWRNPLMQQYRNRSRSSSSNISSSMQRKVYRKYFYSTFLATFLIIPILFSYISSSFCSRSCYRFLFLFLSHFARRTPWKTIFIYLSSNVQVNKSRSRKKRR